jgi:hypothetical protein
VKKIFLTLLILLTSSSALAQAATNNSKLSWNQPLDTLVTTAAQAQALIYKQYPDGITTGIVITGVTCTGTTTVTCTAPLPAYTVGSHTITLTASQSTDATTESLKSNVVSFTFKIIVSAPNSVTIIP